MKVYKMYSSDKCIPSDSTYRKDLMLWMLNNK